MEDCIKSRFCAVCDAVLRWQCSCSNRTVMLGQVKKSFHSGNRNRGLQALENLQDINPDEQSVQK